MLTAEEIESLFPEACGKFGITSDPDDSYNCIAWSVNDKTRPWWPMQRPNPYVFWPTGVDREETVDAFIKMYEAFAFEKCETADFEPGFDKIALYARGDEPTHVARWWEMDRCWSSKLGDENDIEHHSLGAIEGDQYGVVVQIMKRKRGRAIQ